MKGENMEIKILVDTSSFIESFLNKQYLPDMFLLFNVPVKLYTTSSVIKELKGLSRKKSLRGKAALFWQSNFPKENIIKSNKPADDSLLEQAKKMNAAILSQDVELRKRAREQGIRTYAVKNNRIV